MKQQIYASYLDIPALLFGKDHSDVEPLHLEITQRVHHGPKAVQDRQLNLILSMQDAVDLATNVLSHMPVSQLEKLETTQLAKIAKIIDLIIANNEKVERHHEMVEEAV